MLTKHGGAQLALPRLSSPGLNTQYRAGFCYQVKEASGSRSSEDNLRIRFTRRLTQRKSEQALL